VIIEINNISVNEFALYISPSILYKSSCIDIRDLSELPSRIENEKKMDIDITCPNCNFSKTMPGDKIPDGVKWVICPGCKHRFELAPIKPDMEQNGGSPWERREDLGLWQGIYQTFVAVLFSPAGFFRETTSCKRIREPLAFGILLGSLGYMVGFFWKFLLVSMGMMSDAGGFLSWIPVNWLFLIGMIFSPVLVILNMFITGAVIHVLLLAFNGGKGGFGGTFRVIAYGQGTRVLAFIPFIGGVIGWFWNLVVIVTGLKEAHKTSYLKAAAAVIIPFIILGIMLLFVFLLTGLFESIGSLQ